MPSPTPRSLRPGPRSAPWFAVALLSLAPATCFTGDDLVDQPCNSDEDCNTPVDVLGQTLRCQYHVCGYMARCGDGIVDAEQEQCDNGADNVENDHGTRAGDCSASECRLLPYCGDKVVDAPREQCDDGNLEDRDSCLNSCQLAICGDGFVGPGEACDLKVDANCTEDCARPTCGDGLLQGDEACDDGNTDASDDCLGSCVKARCGDGTLWAGIEARDDGNSSDQDTCVAGCEQWSCGDGFVGPGEVCDDGNKLDSDACTKVCGLPTCGDGVLQAGEECDDANADDADLCLGTCLISSCGDAILHVDNGEQCDDGNGDNTDGCLDNCKVPGCGDGFAAAGVEECDDGNNDNTDACLDSCKAAQCGDDLVQAGIEQCDDGNVDSNDGCSATCKHEQCGDGIQQDSESCDDGNNQGGDGCSKICGFEACGDNQVQGSEQCDDGNKINTDDCVACKLASCGDGVTWDGQEECDDGNDDQTDACLGGCALASCGDGFVRAGVEACDDGDADDSDACVQGCELASCGDGHVWAGQEACDDGNASNNDACLKTCVANVCGDGFIDAGSEGCDDQNLAANDGCSNQCRIGATLLGASTGNFHGCVIRNGAMRCWGRNSEGQLGIENTANLGDEPGELPGGDIKTGGAVVKVAAASEITCMLRDTGKVYCWGLNVTGRLGTGSDVYGIVGGKPGEMPPPVAQIGIDAVDIGAGSTHACALLVTGAVRCWGVNYQGQTGYAGQASGQTPASNGDVDIGGVATQIAVGSGHTCALLNGGAVRCWGSNSRGQLGVPGVTNIGLDETPGSKAPVNIGGVAVQIGAGRSHTCAVLDTGRVRCWGEGAYGALGYQNVLDIGDNEVPAVAGDVKMLQPADKAIKVAAGGEHTCALLQGGVVRCWGLGSNGQLGYGNKTSFGNQPGATGLVDAGGKVLDITVGFEHTCVLMDGGGVRCWGENGVGQLGLNHTANIGDGPGEMPPKDSPLYPNP